jgi:hypothetical protein
VDLVFWNIVTIYIQMEFIHSDYILCAWWVLLVTPDSSSSLPGCSMRVLPTPLLLINCLSCSPPGVPGPPPFPPPGLTPFPSGSRHLPTSSSATFRLWSCLNGFARKSQPSWNPQKMFEKYNKTMFNCLVTFHHAERCFQSASKSCCSCFTML